MSRDPLPEFPTPPPELAGHKRPTLVLRAVEVEELLQALLKLSAACHVLGYPEDEVLYARQAEILLNRLYGAREPRTLTGGSGRGF